MRVCIWFHVHLLKLKWMNYFYLCHNALREKIRIHSKIAQVPSNFSFKFLFEESYRYYLIVWALYYGSRLCQKSSRDVTKMESFPDECLKCKWSTRYCTRTTTCTVYWTMDIHVARPCLICACTILFSTTLWLQCRRNFPLQVEGVGSVGLFYSFNTLWSMLTSTVWHV